MVCSRALALSLGLTASAWALAAGPASAVASPAVAAPTSSAAKSTRVSDCGALGYKPAGFVIWCFHSDTVAQGVRWTTWTSRRAVGRGMVSSNTCAISCADGPWVDYPATFVADRSRSTKGRRVYTRLTIRYTADAPEGSDGRATYWLSWRREYPGASRCALLWVTKDAGQWYPDTDSAPRCGAF